MNALCVALNWAALLTGIVGTGVAAANSIWLFVPVLIVFGSLGYCSRQIHKHQSRIAAEIGIALMVLFVIAGVLFPLVVRDMILSLVSAVFFMLGLVGLVGAYKNRKKWMAW